jgi:membrane fusion protein (multidrug efflux system)
MSVTGLRFSILAAAFMLSACGSNDQAAKKAGTGGPIEVGFVVVQPTSVPLTTELAARTAAFETSEVRPQVSGLIRDRNFTEGSIVRAGQTLYRIDPSLYDAQAAQARANLASAAATLEGARIRADRFRPLAEAEAVSKQDYTDAVATSRQAAASVAQNRAALETARINVNFTRVPAPITGRIGRSLATVGALVTTNQVDPLAVIQRLDPMYVDIQQSSASLLALRRALARDEVMPATAEVRLKLEDGSDYGFSGRVQFAEVTVDQATGTVTLRATFPNPQGLLLPGMFVRASFAQSIDTNAFLVPQAAVARDPTGNATLYIVGPNNKAGQRKVTATRTQGAFWVVTSGLKPGDKVIVQGTGRLKPNADIKPVPADSVQRIAPPPAGGTQGGASAKGR